MKHESLNKVFKQHLKAFAEEVMETGEKFVKEIDGCETNEDLFEVLQENAKLIFEKLDGECDSCDSKDVEIDDLKDEKSDLEDEKSGLEDSVSELTYDIEEIEKVLTIGFIPETILDEYKLEAFKKAINKFSMTEFEELLA